MVGDTGATIAVDSLENDFHHKPQQGCKIHKDGELYWTSVGLLVGGGTGFNLPKIVSSSANKNLSPSMTVEDATSSIIQPLQKEYDWMKAHDPKEYNYIMKEAVGGYLRIYFVWREMGHISWRAKDFRIVNEKVTLAKPEIETTCAGLPPDKLCAYIDASDDIKKYNVKHLDELWTSENFLPSIKLLMEKGRNEFPKSVGPPYSILLILPHTTKWLDAGLCNF